MNRVLIFSTDVYTDLNDSERVTFINMLEKFISLGDGIIFTANREEKKDELSEINFDEQGVLFTTRSELRDAIKSNLNGELYFIVIGNKDADLQFAATNKLLYLVPQWCRSFEELPKKYGIKVDGLKAFDKIISIIENQKSWFYRLDLDEKTTILSLTNANNYGASSEENEMINGFRAYLKNGNKKYYRILLIHFLAAISNNPEFRDIRDWAVFPSSGTIINPDMILFKEKARELMNGRKKEDLFVRHTATWKSHDSYKYGYDRLPADRHFDTIRLNDIYKGKLKGRVVCVFDDYLTNGTSFEAARNLLIKENVKKVFFISLGKFHKNNMNQYLQQNYNITGDVFSPSYKYNKINTKWHCGKFNNEAVNEIKNLHDIIYRQ